VLGTVSIRGVFETNNYQAKDDISLQEKALGDYTPGRWAWRLEDPVRFITPVPVKGAQGIWSWDDTKIK
jgi:hypothetical protein